MHSNSNVYGLLCVCNALESQVIEFLLTESLLREEFLVFARLSILKSSALGEVLLHIKRYILSRSLSIWKENTILKTQVKYTEMFDQKELWNKSQGNWIWVEIQRLPSCLILDKAFDLPNFNFTSAKWSLKDNAKQVPLNSSAIF